VFLRKFNKWKKSMNFNEIQRIMKIERENKFLKSNQLSLGKFIEELEGCGLKWMSGDEEKDKGVCFDFGSAIPTTLHSWRGSYSELALGYEFSGYDRNSEDHFVEKTVNALLKELKEAIGKSFYGWKGGEFVMDENTPVWVSNSGNSSNTGVIGVLDDGFRSIIITQYMEY
jgi:hypothetical protein